MISPTPEPIIYTSPPSNTNNREQDCACSISNEGIHQTQSSTEENGEETDLESDIGHYTLPTALYTEKLSEEHFLLYNAWGHHGVIVLNTPSFQILNVLAQANSLYEAQSKLNNQYTINEMHTLAKSFIDLSFLVRENTHPTLPKPDFLTVWLHLTNQCNLRCKYCYLTKSPRSMTPAVLIKALKMVHQTAIDNNIAKIKIKYSGGEPTLQFPLIQAGHNYIKSLGANPQFDEVIMSNGISWTNHMMEYVIQENIRLATSLDSTASNQDSQRTFSNNAPTSHIVQKTLERFVNKGGESSVTITLTKQNIDNLEPIIEFVLEKDIPFTLNFYRENQASPYSSLLKPTNAELINGLQKAYAIIEKNHPNFSLLDGLLSHVQLQAPHNLPCGAGYSYFVINTHGEISKCHMTMDDQICELDHPDIYSLIRSSSNKPQNIDINQLTDCQDCFWKYACAGGCPEFRAYTNNDYNSKSPNCEAIQTLIPQILRLEGKRILQEKYQYLYQPH